MPAAAGGYADGPSRHPADATEESFPLADSVVADRSLEWLVAGQRRLLDDDAFVAAFDGLESIPKGWKPVTREKFKTLAGWKQQQLFDALRVPPPFRYDFPHGEVTPVADISSIDWSSCVGVQRSDTGSEGIVFVELKGQRAVCVKCPSKIVAEMYGTLLCQKLAIRCPAMRILERNSEEGQQIVRALVAADSKRPEAARKVETMLRYPLLLVIEYLQATELADLIPPASAEWASDSFGLPSDMSSGQLSEVGKSTLRFFGSLIAFDMIINNFDRLPCMWANGGNPGNVLFAKKNNDPVSIDNMVNCIYEENTEAIGVFVRHVRQICSAVAREPDIEHEEFKRVRTLLRDGASGHGWPGLAIEVGSEGTIEVQRGFLRLARLAAFGEGLNPEDRGFTLHLFEEIRDGLLQFLPEGRLDKDSQSAALYGFASVSPQFCAAVVEQFRCALNDADAAARQEQQATSAAPPVAAASSQLQVVWQKSEEGDEKHRHTCCLRGDECSACLIQGDTKHMITATTSQMRDLMQTLLNRKRGIVRAAVQFRKLARQARDRVRQRKCANAAEFGVTLRSPRAPARPSQADSPTSPGGRTAELDAILKRRWKMIAEATEPDASA
eukprot:TRINITY_DN11178_c1_g2_i1.p1 TRINITY_DN11178_c1_g2~~TRINITY_DN11178_c1_g2_i1.p1  ORF type:complete len:628 (-),score=153.59 TRINITY_DN11178_c1_g2_i1:57-1895(-)